MPTDPPTSKHLSGGATIREVPQRLRLHWQTFLPYTALIVLVLVLYSRALSFPLVSWDDHSLLSLNPIISEMSFATLWTVFTSFVDPELYIPLTFLTYQIEYRIVGLEPFLYHLDNILLHAANACLVFALLARWIRSKTVALLLALAFAAHPLNVEAVAWVSARKDLLSATFALLSILLYERFLDHRGWWALLGSVLLFACSLLSKVSAVFLPLALILVDVMLGRPLRRQVLVEKVPFFLLSLLFGIVALLEKSAVDMTLSPIERAILIMKGILFTFAKFLWPSPLSIVYPASGVSLLEPSILLPLALIGILCLWAWRRRYFSRTAVMGFLLAMLLLLPSILIPKRAGVPSFPSDKYLYLPMLGLLLSIGITLQKRVSTAGSRLRLPIGVAALIIVLTLSIFSFRRMPTWANSMSLYDDALKHFPGDSRMHYNRGTELLAIGMLPEAESSLRAAIERRPDFANAYANLGTALLGQRKTEEGVFALQEAIRLNPDHAAAHNALGSVYLDLGQLDAAIAEFTAAIAIDPGMIHARYNLITAYGRSGMLREMQEETRKVLELERK